MSILSDFEPTTSNLLSTLGERSFDSAPELDEGLTSLVDSVTARRHRRGSTAAFKAACRIPVLRDWEDSRSVAYQGARSLAMLEGVTSLPEWGDLAPSLHGQTYEWSLRALAGEPRWILDAWILARQTRGGLGPVGCADDDRSADPDQDGPNGPVHSDDLSTGYGDTEDAYPV